MNRSLDRHTKIAAQAAILVSFLVLCPLFELQFSRCHEKPVPYSKFTKILLYMQ